jgi:hypothetical protein
MTCHQPITYVIRAGDNLYHLSRYYKTTVPALLGMNPGIDPYNLKIGSTLMICPGDGFHVVPENPNPPACPNPAMQIKLKEDMRQAWMEHVFWTRLLIVSITERLRDQDATTARLLRNPGDIAAVFAEYYPKNITDAIAKLLTEHLTIGSSLITALRDGQTAKADTLKRQWYMNADQMAAAFAGINPFYDQELLRQMLYTHLDLTTKEVAMQLAGNFAASINTMDEVEREALMMADYFSKGIKEQFPHQFD